MMKDRLPGKDQNFGFKVVIEKINNNLKSKDYFNLFNLSYKTYYICSN